MKKYFNFERWGPLRGYSNNVTLWEGVATMSPNDTRGLKKAKKCHVFNTSYYLNGHSCDFQTFSGNLHS